MFASLSDYCREYGDCSELYSAVDKLAVYEDLESQVAGLDAAGVCLVAATRHVAFMASEQDSGPGLRTEVLYVVAFPKGKAPEQIAGHKTASVHLSCTQTARCCRKTW